MMFIGTKKAQGWLVGTISALLCVAFQSPASAGDGLEPGATGEASSEVALVDADALFEQFAGLLQRKQQEIIDTLEKVDGSGQRFSKDAWGSFLDGAGSRGGITRVFQGGDVIERGAVSFTLIRGGVLSAERAAAIRSRQSVDMIEAGDSYSTAALTTVHHARNPMVPTFRSDVRLFMVATQDGRSLAWFGGGADLTPNYLFEEDITYFHQHYRALSELHLKDDVAGYSYESMKATCDEYFYLPARAEHRGTGGIFFDDMPANE